MKKRLLDVKLDDIFENLFYVAFSALAFLQAVLNSQFLWPWSRFFNLRGYIALLCFSLLWIRKMSSKKWLCFFTLLMVFLKSRAHTGNQNFVFILIVIFFLSSSSNEDNRVIDKSVKALGIGVLAAMIVVVGSAALGFISNNVTEGDRVRHALGFNLPVMISGFYLNFGYAFLYLHRKKLTLIKCLILLAPATVIFFLTDGRMSFMALIFVTILSYIFTKTFQTRRELVVAISTLSAKLIYIFSFFFSIYAAANFLNSSTLQALNRFTTGRLGWFSRYWEIYDPTLWGQYLVRVSSFDARRTGQRMMILDNAYLTLLLEHGIVISLLVTLILFLLLSHLKKEGDIVSILIWLSIFLTFNVANTSLNFWRNPLIFQFILLINDFKWRPFLIKKRKNKLTIDVSGG